MHIGDFGRRVITATIFASIFYIQPIKASQWIYVGSSNGSDYYIDFDSVRGFDAQRNFWGKETNYQGRATSLTKYHVDCSAWQIAIEQNIAYYSSGSVNPYRSYDASRIDFSEIPPGTIGDGYADFICERITPQPNPRMSAPTDEYPKAFCGDQIPNLAGTYALYPVYTTYSQNSLNFIVTNLCADAFETVRDNGTVAIQVASFTDNARASDFARFLESHVGGAEVGQPTFVTAQ